MPLISRRGFMQVTGAAALALRSPRALANSADFAEDVEILRAAMEIHPGALRYLNPAALDAALDGFAAEFEAQTTLEARYLVLSRFLSRLQCGHSYANFFNQSKAVRSALFDRPTRLPFAFRWIGKDMVVTDSGPDGTLLPGTIITQINGVAPAAMLDALLPYTRADGAAPGKRKALLEVQHRSKIEFFDVFHGLVYGAPEGGAHRIEAQSPDGRTTETTLPAIDLAQRRAMRAAAMGAPGPEDPLWDFEIREGVGILTMSSWSVFRTQWDWKGWLDVRLDETAELKGLIIDNRRNEGGDITVGEQVLSRLISEPAPLPDIRRLVRFRTFPGRLRPHAKTWDESFFSIGENAEPVGFGFYALPASTLRRAIVPRGRTIPVPVALLTSPTNSSATFTFALLAQFTGRMTLVGEPTGGNRRGINGDGFFFTTLPRSGIEFDLPMVGQFPPTPQPDQGVLPDIPISETAADIAAGRDATLERALSLF